MRNVDINEALRTYIDADPSGGVRPYAMVERIRTRYGANWATVESAIQQALDGLLEVPTAMQVEPLEAIASFVEERAHRLRPELAADVCRAIGNYVSYSFR